MQLPVYLWHKQAAIKHAHSLKRIQLNWYEASYLVWPLCQTQEHSLASSSSSVGCETETGTRRWRDERPCGPRPSPPHYACRSEPASGWVLWASHRFLHLRCSPPMTALPGIWGQTKSRDQDIFIIQAFIQIENCYIKLQYYFTVVHFFLYFWSNKCSLDENYTFILKPFYCGHINNLFVFI